MFPWDKVDGLWTMKSKGVGLIDRTISFQDFQPTPDPPTSQSDKRTDGETDGRHANSTALCTSRGREWYRSKEFLPLLCSSTPLVPTPTSSPPNFPMFPCK